MTPSPSLESANGTIADGAGGDVPAAGLAMVDGSRPGVVPA